jgi:hypothetical protein
VADVIRIFPPVPGRVAWRWNTIHGTETIPSEVEGEPPIVKHIRLVQLQLDTESGTSFAFFRPDDVESFFRASDDAVQEARTGIVRASGMPVPMQQPPNGDPSRRT